RLLRLSVEPQHRPDLLGLRHCSSSRCGGGPVGAAPRSSDGRPGSAEIIGPASPGPKGPGGRAVRRAGATPRVSDMEFPPWTNAIGHAGEVRVRALAASGRFPLLRAGALLAALGCATAGTGWVRTELFLGRGLPDGGTLSEAQVEAFLAREAGSRLGGWTLVEAR